MTEDEDFSDFVKSRWGRLVRSVVLLGCSSSEAEDIVQSALIRCLIHWSRVRQADDMDAYVHRVLINTFTSARRRRWTGERAVAIVPERHSDDETENVDRTDAVVRALGRLTQDHRTAVVLRYYSNLSEGQMGAVLGVARGTVKSRLSRALNILSEDPNLAELRGSYE
jgi:RNA polymerase sigma-70 factor (sigma-E family)